MHAGRAGNVNAGPTTNKRSIESTVVVDDGQILVLGGLIRTSTPAARSKVPLLGDIPVLGALFRSESRTRTQDQPDGLPAPGGDARRRRDANALSLDRYDLIRAAAAGARSRGRASIVPINEAPVLPPPAARSHRRAAAVRGTCRRRFARRPCRRRRPPRTGAAPRRQPPPEPTHGRPPSPALRLRQGEHAAARGRRRAARAVGGAETGAGARCREVLRLYAVDALEREPRPRWPSASPRPTPAASRAPPPWSARSRARSTCRA